MKWKFKKELAHAAGVSNSTFSRWFNKNIPEIEKELNITINRKNKLIHPKVVKWVCEKYCIDLD